MKKDILKLILILIAVIGANRIDCAAHSGLKAPKLTEAKTEPRNAKEYYEQQPENKGKKWENLTPSEKMNWTRAFEAYKTQKLSSTATKVGAKAAGPVVKQEQKKIELPPKKFMNLVYEYADLPTAPAKLRELAVKQAIKPHLIPVLSDIVKGYAELTTEDIEDATNNLIQAIRKNDLKGVDDALDSGADINFIDNNGFTPLSIAAADGRLAIARKLLQNGANPNLLSQKILVIPPLFTAIYTNKFDLAQLLIDNGASFSVHGTNYLTHFVSLRPADFKTIEFLLKNKIDINAVDDEDGTTPLEIAIRFADPEVLKLLLRYNPNVNIITQDGFPILILAIHRNIHEDDILEIIRKKPSLEDRDPEGNTALLATLLRNAGTRIYKALLEAGANPDVTNNDGVNAVALLETPGYKAYRAVYDEFLAKKGKAKGA